MKNEYIFTHSYEGYDGDAQEVVIKTNTVSLLELLSAFKDFLAGCGFQVQTGEIEFVEYEPEPEPPPEEEDDCRCCRSAERIEGGGR